VLQQHQHQLNISLSLAAVEVEQTLLEEAEAQADIEHLHHFPFLLEQVIQLQLAQEARLLHRDLILFLAQ